MLTILSKQFEPKKILLIEIIKKEKKA